MQRALVHVRRQEDVQRLRLTNVGRPVPGMLNEPALINFKRGLEHVFFLLREEVQMLNRSFVGKDRRPCIIIIMATFLKDFCQVIILNREGSRKRFMRIGIGRGWFNPR